MNKFTIEYDEPVEEVLEKINECLKKHNLIIYLIKDNDDGYVTYELTQYKRSE